ncbi:MAG: gliding motility-associated C-terminal domain-containing protein, partial [Bacteroidales bacterium]|nr:gliding motility-associated C-terminal domain-containing protein [Bacteroidales bacterium]
LRFSICAFDLSLNLDPEDLTACVGDIMDFEFDGPILELNTFNSDPRITVPAFGPIPCLEDLDLSFDIPCIGEYDLLEGFNYWPTTQEISFFPIEFGLARTLKSKHPLSKYAKCIAECAADSTKSPADCVSIGNLSRTIAGTEKLDDFLVGQFSLPFIDTLYTTVSKNNLRSLGADTALSMEFRPLNLIAGGKYHDGSFEFPIPCTSGNFYVDYLLIRPTFNLDVLAKQDMNLDAKVVVTLQLPDKLTYKVVNTKGVTVKSGLDKVISYEVGNDLYIDFPCNYEYIDFKPTFRVENKFTNRTYASINMDGKLQAIGMGIGLDEITVIPEIELCVPNPFGDDWCVTIPEVSFGFDVSVGPLIDESISDYMADPDDMNIEIDIFKDTWEIESFQQIPAPSFRVAPARFVATVAPDTLDCFGGTDGELEVFTRSGSPPFSYEWSNGSSQKTAITLPAGEHYVKVTDKNGCQTLSGTAIFEYAKLEIASSTLIHPECFGDATGSITCVIKGGKPPYNYSWSNGGGAAGIASLIAGEYTLTVIDQNGCSLTRTYTIKQPTELRAYVNNKVDVLCNGKNSGSIMVNVSGGVPNYDYFWSNGGISKDLDSLVAGEYLLTVVDKNNCRVSLTETINDPEYLSAVIEVQKPISCYRGDDGELFANINGGVAPYELVWNNPQYTLNNSLFELKPLKEGVYQVEVFDANKCYRIDTLYLKAPSERFMSTLTETHLSCNAADDGRFDLSVSGGTAPYQFSWSDGSNEQNRTDLAAGQYKVTITDSKACVTQNNMVLLEPFELDGNFKMKKVSCEGELDGILEFFPKGGTPGYFYYWDDGSVYQEAINLPQGMHSVMVSDAKGCKKEFSIDLLVSGIDCFDIPNAFSPNGDGYNDTWVIKNIKTQYPNHLVSIFTAQGNQLYTCERGAYVPWDGKLKDKAVPTGTYYYILDFGNGSSPQKGTLTIIR